MLNTIITDKKLAWDNKSLNTENIIVEINNLQISELNKYFDDINLKEKYLINGYGIIVIKINK